MKALEKAIALKGLVSQEVQGREGTTGGRESVHMGGNSVYLP